MKKFLMMLISTLLVVSVVGCGSSSSDSDSSVQNLATNGKEVVQGNSQEQNETSSEVNTTTVPGPFTDGKFGRIDITEEKYDNFGVNDGSKVVEGSTFVDIRNKWEREEPGQPVEVVKDMVIYEFRTEDRVGDYLNDNFVKEMTDLADGDKNKKIVLICHTGSRSANAAQLLSKKGFTNIYDIEGGFAEWEKKFHTDSYSNLYK